ncbi:MAG: enoyl-CoA hydratase/isomerase family protein [Myxococcales bacterium]|nr:enoyl-CoA hydratase/isomerase family protein [Myxococcales bacterium]
MNRPRRLNGWTTEMVMALNQALEDAAADPETKAVIVTGTGRYYCAGVNLAGALTLAHPQTVHDAIVAHNRALFEMFIAFPKPILVAANGPAVGAAVTTAALCDGFIAADSATFSTPFFALGVCPEGCSAQVFPHLMGSESANRMLAEEGWQPTAAEAVAAGLVQAVHAPDDLQDEAQRIAEGWADSAKKREYRGPLARDELIALNARESVDVANAFLSPPFLKGQFRFLWRKKKRVPAAMFLALWTLRPAWTLLLRKPT